MQMSITCDALFRSSSLVGILCLFFFISIYRFRGIVCVVMGGFFIWGVFLLINA